MYDIFDKFGNYVGSIADSASSLGCELIAGSLLVGGILFLILWNSLRPEVKSFLELSLTVLLFVTIIAFYLISIGYCILLLVNSTKAVKIPSMIISMFLLYLVLTPGISLAIANYLKIPWWDAYELSLSPIRYLFLKLVSFLEWIGSQIFI